MAIALVQSAEKDVANANSTTLAFTSNLGAGNLVLACNVIFQITADRDIVTPTDTRGHTYLPATNQQDDSGNITHLRSFYVGNSLAGADTVTYQITGGANGEITAIQAEFSGLSTTSPISGTPTLTGPTTTANPNTGSMTPADNGCLIIAVLHAAGNQPITPPGSPWIQLQEYEGQNDTVSLSVIYQIQTTAAAVSATWALGISTTCLSHIFALKPAVVGSTATITAAGGELPDVAEGTIGEQAVSAIENILFYLTKNEEILTIAESSYEVSESDGTLTVSFDRENARGFNTVPFTVNFIPGTAVAGTNYNTSGPAFIFGEQAAVFERDINIINAHSGVGVKKTFQISIGPPPNRFAYTRGSLSIALITINGVA
jgi:hypothetical protein